jgi:hypothetical protein
MTLLHPAYFAPLRAMRVAAFDHTAVLTPSTEPGAEHSVRLPNGEYERVPVEGLTMVGKLTRPSLRAAEQAAALGVKADGVWKAELGTVIPRGTTLTVSGSTADVAWERAVKVTAQLRGDRINARFAVEDVALDQPGG